MGKRDKGHRETKKPKKVEKREQSLTPPPSPSAVEVVRKKRKGEEPGAE